MADNIAITQGAGTTIGTDDVGGVQYQQVKLIDPTLDSATPMATNIGVSNNQTFRVVNVVDSVSSVNVTNATLAVTQSGTWDEVGINDSGNSITVDVTDIFATTATSNVVNADNRVKVELPATTVAVTESGSWAVQVQDSQASTISSHIFATDFRGLDTYVGGIFNSTTADILNADNRLKVELPATTVAATQSGTWDEVGINDSGNSITVDVTDIFATTATSNVVDPDNRLKVDVNMIAGLNETNAGVLRTVQMTDSASSVVVNSGTITTVSTVTGVTNTVNVRLDSTDGVYTAANPFPISIASGALTSTIVVGDTLARTADIGAAPVKVGGIATQTNPTAFADGDRSYFRSDDLGRQLTRNIQVRDLIATAYVTLTTGTEATFLAAGGAGVFLDCISVLCANQSSAAVNIDFRAVTAGNVEFTVEVPAGGPGGITFAVPWPQSATNNNWTVDMPDITGTTVNISGLFSKEV